MTLPDRLAAEEVRMSEPYALRPTQVAERLQVSRRTVYTLLETRQLGYILVGGQYRIRQADIEAYEARTWHAPVSTNPAIASLNEPVVTMSGGGNRAGTAFQRGQRIAAKQSGSSPNSSPAR